MKHHEKLMDKLCDEIEEITQREVAARHMSREGIRDLYHMYKLKHLIKDHMEHESATMPHNPMPHNPY